MSILQMTLHHTSCSTTTALDCLALADGIDRLSQNVGMELPFYTALNPRRAQISKLLSLHSTFDKIQHLPENMAIYIFLIHHLKERRHLITVHKVRLILYS